MQHALRTKTSLFVLIFLIAAAGRILNIDQESLWVDEGFSYWVIQHDDPMGLLLNDVHPPIYFMALRGWAEITGISELALRYFSVLPSLLSVAVIYQVAREIERDRLWDKRTAIPMLAALLLALADMENYVAQEARNYTWHVLFVLLSWWLLLRWVRTQKRRTYVLWILASIAMLYTHYITAAVLVVQAGYALLFLRYRGRPQILIGLTAITVLFAPWMLVVVSNQTENIGTGFNVPSTLESLWNWRINWFTQQWALMIGLALFGLLTIYRSKGKPDRIIVKLNSDFLLLMWIIVPVAGAYVLNHYTPILMDYRLVQITPAIVLLIAFGLGNFRQPALGFLIAVILVYGVAIDDTPRPRPPWREVGLNAAQYAEPGDLALADVTPSGDWQVIYYYDRFMPESVERRSLRQWRIEEPESYPTGLPALVEAHDTVWLMHWSQNRDAFTVLEETGHVQTAVMSEDWLGNDLNVYRYDVIPDDDIAAFTNGMRLRGAEVIFDDLRLDLWWSTDSIMNDDYTMSAILLDHNGVLVAQDDSYPFNGQRLTSTFSPDEIVYDPHVLTIRDDLDSLPPGTYTAAVKVYLWTPEGIKVQNTNEGEEFAVIGTVEVSG